MNMEPELDPAATHFGIYNWPKTGVDFFKASEFLAANGMEVDSESFFAHETSYYGSVVLQKNLHEQNQKGRT